MQLSAWQILHTVFWRSQLKSHIQVKLYLVDTVRQIATSLPPNTSARWRKMCICRRLSAHWIWVTYILPFLWQGGQSETKPLSTTLMQCPCWGMDFGCVSVSRAQTAVQTRPLNLWRASSHAHPHTLVHANCGKATGVVLSYWTC